MRGRLKILKKQQKGITLIALVITIIVLLILAGVSIAMLTGNNGILTQAQRAKEQTEVAAENEEAILNQIEQELTNATSGGTTGGEITPEEGITASDIAKDISAIGKEVTGYECTNSAGINKWLIFYADENNIYLIANDYIYKDYCPNSGTQSMKTNGSGYEFAMNNATKDYKGAENITDSRIKALNNDYFSKYESSNSTYGNMKATAYMLDTNVWSVYAGEKAEYAIGGPTIELFFKSYNKKYGTAYVASAINNKGYQIGDGDTLGYNLLLSADKTLPYMVTSNNKASTMWIASPTADRSKIFRVSYDGIIDSYAATYNVGGGFRPIVCLKSSVRLIKTGENTYQIK